MPRLGAPLIHHGRWRGDAGTALIEFAILLPFLTTVVFGVLDIGRVYSLQDRLTNIAREGGTYAQFFPTRVASQTPGDLCDPQSITTRALNEEPSLKGVTITVTDATTGKTLTGCNTQAVQPGDRIRVKAAIQNFQPLTPLVQAIVGSNFTITGSIDVVAQG